jgi:hypothetical protein
MGLVLLGTYWMTGVVLLGLAALCCVGLWISMAKAKSILRQGEIRYLQEEARWRQALARWDELFYCSRCDSVSNPRTSQSARAGAMYSLLY